MEDYIGKSINSEDGLTSDFWLFDDDYIKEIKYDEESNTQTFIYEIKEFLKTNICPKLIKKIKDFKRS